MKVCNYCFKEFRNSKALLSHISKVHREEYLNQNIKIYNKTEKKYDELDITHLELEELRKNHSNRCDICGKIETANTSPKAKDYPNKLCIDHNHDTLEFRGFLCVQCNRNMGWYDKYKEQIHIYLNKAEK